MRKIYLFTLLALLIGLSYNVQAQQLLDSANVFYVNNTSDNNTGTNGTLMNDNQYREFLQSNPVPASTDGWWSNNSSIYLGGNHRRASRYGSGNNTGAHAQLYFSTPITDHYLVYTHMNSANATTNCYVMFKRFGESTPVDSFRFNMQTCNTPDGYGSWVPLGIVEIFAADSALTVDFGLDSLGQNTLRVDGIALVRSSKAGPDIEIGPRRFTRLSLDPVTGDTLLNHSFYRDRSPIGFSETTFKYGSYSEKKQFIYNLGSQPLTVTGFVTQTNRFSVTTPTPFIVPAGGKTEITIRFSPLGEEVTRDTLLVLSNDADEPEARLPLIGTGINYNFVLNASVSGSEPHWNVPFNSGSQELVGSFLNSTASPWIYPIPGGNLGSIVNTGTDPNIAVIYRFQIPDSLSGSYFLEYSGPAGSSNAAQNVTVDVVTPFYTNPVPELGDTQRVTGFNSRAVTATNLWARIGGNRVFQLNGGDTTVVRYTNPSQGGTELLRADLLRVRLVPIAPTISTSLDPTRLLNYGSVSIYDSIRLQEFNFQRNFIIGSNGETPLRIDTIWLSSGQFFHFDNLPPTFPVTLPAIDGELNLLLSFLPDSIIRYSDTLWVKCNDPNDSLIFVRLSGQGVGTGITVDDTDPTTYIYPADPIVWTGTPDPTNMDKWYRVQGSGGFNQNRLFHYIYFNAPNGPEKVEWYPYFPFKPGSTTNDVDSFDVTLQLSAGSNISSPMAKYVVNHVGPNSPSIIYVNQNASPNGQVNAAGQVYLGRFLFLRGGQDYHGSGTIYGSIELHNDTAAVSQWYADSAINRARQDSFVLRADAIILEQAGAPRIIAEPSMTPDVYSLSQNYPNPFNPTTQIRFSIPVDGKVDLRVYDMLGREIAVLMKDELKAGYYTVEWNGKNNYGTPVSTGMYIYRINAGKFVQTKKMILMK